MKEVFVDLHIHIGRSSNGKPVKITGSRNLNFENIAHCAREKKGINFVGIIDCASPYVIEDIENFLKNGDAFELENGGILFKDEVCIILGSEVETTEKRKDGKYAVAHNLCYFPFLSDIKAFSKEMEKYITNINLSTQKARICGYDLLKIVQKHNGVLIPAHIFTPFKSYYGRCTDSLKDSFKDKYSDIFAVELGLSADTVIADSIYELKDKAFLTNSDAHSLEKIGREYNKILVSELSYKGIFDAIKNSAKLMRNEKVNNKSRIIANYGMDPKLGKYHRTFCDTCLSLSEIKTDEKGKEICKKCGSKKITRGVFERVEEIKNGKSKKLKNRTKYVYQVPLEFLPGIGKKTIDKMLNEFSNEMNILHNITIDTIEAEFGEKIAKSIDDLRKEKFVVSAGGGGNYGKIVK